MTLTTTPQHDRMFLIPYEEDEMRGRPRQLPSGIWQVRVWWQVERREITHNKKGERTGNEKAGGGIMNSITEIAQKNGRDYITPEDVSEAFKKSRFLSQRVRLEVLEILGKQTEYGAEDPGLCAFIAWKGK